MPSTFTPDPVQPKFTPDASFTPDAPPDTSQPTPGGHDLSSLRQLWLDAGGAPETADLMSHVAYAESAGNAGALGPGYMEKGVKRNTHGLWQISDVHGNGNWNDPLTNAREAVALYKESGTTPWLDSRDKGAGGGWGQYANAAGAVTFTPDVAPKPATVAKAKPDPLRPAKDFLATLNRPIAQSASAASVFTPDANPAAVKAAPIAPKAAAAGFETPKNVRENLLRQLGAGIGLFGSGLGAAWESIPALNSKQHPAGNYLAKALDTYKKAGGGLAGYEAVNREFDPYGDASIKRAGIDPKKTNPFLRGAGEFGLTWFSPENMALGKGVEGAAGLAGLGFRAARRASPVVDAAATAVGKGVAKAAAPVQALQTRANNALFATAMAGARKLGYSTKSLVDRYAAAGLPQRGGATYTKAGFAAQAAPLHAMAVVEKKIDDIYRGLSSEQAREVQKHSYVDADTGEQHYDSSASKVAEPKKGPSLSARGIEVRKLIYQSDKLQAELGIRDPAKKELMDSGMYYPMRQFDHPVYASQERNAAAEAGHDVPLVKAGTGRSAYPGRGSQFKASTSKPGRQTQPSILDDGVEADLHPEYDPAYQLKQHLREAHRAIANEQQRRLLESVPNIDPATGIQRVTNYLGFGGETPLTARMAPLYGLQEGRDAPLLFGLGETGAASQAKYIHRQAKALSESRALQDPAYLAAAAKHGVDPAKGANLFQRATGAARARLSEAGQLQERAARFTDDYKATVARGKAAAAKRASGAPDAIARGPLGKAIASVKRVNADVSSGTGRLGEALAHNLASAAEARATALGSASAAKEWEADAQRLRALSEGSPTKQAIFQTAREMHDPIAADWASKDPGAKSVVPDWVYKDGAWKLTGEFVDIPKRFLDLSTKPKAAPYSLEDSVVVGNVDDVATHSGHRDGDELRDWMQNEGRQRPLLKDQLAEAEKRQVAAIKAGHAETLEQMGLTGLSPRAAVRKIETEGAMFRKLADDAQKEAEHRAFAERELGPAARGAVASGERTAGRLTAAEQHLREAHAARVVDETKATTKRLDQQGAMAERLDRDLKARVDHYAAKYAKLVAESKTSEAFRKAAGSLYDDAYAEIKRAVEAESPRAPEGYVLESTLGLGSPTAREMAIDKPFSDFFTSVKNATIVDKDEAKHLLRVWQNLNRMSRLSIVLVPTVHGINNLGMGYLAEGGTPEQMAKILSRKAVYSDELKARAYKAGAASEHSQQMFSAGTGYHATLPVGERADLVANKTGPLRAAVRPLASGVLHMEHIYNGMNEWLFRDVEQGYAFDLFDRFTKAGMDDGAAAMRVKNVIGRGDNISPSEAMLQLNKIMYFYPWMKTAIPFWTKKGLLDPKWWSAPVRAIQTSNEAQGYDDPSKPFTGKFGEMADGENRLITVPVPQRATEMVANVARIPYDLASLVGGNRAGMTDALDDAKAPFNYLMGHFSAPIQAGKELYDATRHGGAAPWNVFHTDKNAPGPAQAAQLAGNLGGLLFAPASRLASIATDPQGTLASFALGGFSYGSKGAGLKAKEASVRATIGGIFNGPIKEARDSGQSDLAATLTQRRDAAVKAALARLAAGAQPKPTPPPVKGNVTFTPG